MKPETNYQTILLIFLCLTFFTACDLDTLPDPVPTICPPPFPFEISVKGKVNNQQDKGLNGIRIIVPCICYHIPAETTVASVPEFSPIIVKDTFYTATDGSFQWEHGMFYSDTIRVNLQFSDPDGQYPHYASDSLQLLFTEEDWKTSKLQKEITVFLKEQNDQ